MRVRKFIEIIESITSIVFFCLKLIKKYQIKQCFLSSSLFRYYVIKQQPNRRNSESNLVSINGISLTEFIINEEVHFDLFT